MIKDSCMQVSLRCMQFEVFSHPQTHKIQNQQFWLCPCLGKYWTFSDPCELYYFPICICTPKLYPLLVSLLVIMKMDHCFLYA